MNNLESFILRQKEIDICNNKIKKYEKKYKIKNDSNDSSNIQKLNDYLNEQLQLFKYDGFEKNILMDDINILSKYLYNPL